MKKLKLEDISFYQEVEFSTIGKVFEGINNFNYDFSLGKVYGLKCGLGDGGWGLSWLIAGITRERRGQILFDDEYIPVEKRREISCAVGLPIKKKSIFKYTVRDQLNDGIKQNNFTTFKNIDELVDLMHLSPERLDRPIDELSNERWRAGVAVGLAFGRKIFCFPWMRNDFISNFMDIWFIDLINVLKKYEALIIIPTLVDKRTENVFDELIEIKQEVYNTKN